MIRRAIAFLGVLVAALVTWTPALALPTTREIINGLTAKRPVISSIEAQASYRSGSGSPETNIGSEDQSTDPNRTAQARLFFHAPEQVRLNISQPGREETFLAVGSRTLALLGDQVVEASWPVPALVFQLLTEKDPNRFEALLRGARVDLAVVSPGQAGLDLVYILGARAGDLVRPQIWIDRQSLLPIRLILASGGKVDYDLRLSRFRRHEPGLDWPDRLMVDAPGKPTVWFESTSLSINPRIEGQAMDIERLEESLTLSGEQSTDPDLALIHRQMEWLRHKLE